MARKRTLMERTEPRKRKAIALDLFEKRALDRSYRVKPEPKNALQRLLRRFTGGIKFRVSWPRYRGISEYESVLGLKPGRLKELIEKRMQGAKNGKVDVLDIGCGTGIFLAQLKKEFGERVNAEGIALARPVGAKRIKNLHELLSQKKRLSLKEKNWLKLLEVQGEKFRERTGKSGIKVHTGLAETHDYKKKFDLIFSSEALLYAVNPVQALENSLNHLKTGGEAFLHFGINNPLKKKQVTERLMAQGIEVTPLGKWAYHFTKKTGSEIRLV